MNPRKSKYPFLFLFIIVDISFSLWMYLNKQDDLQDSSLSPSNLIPTVSAPVSNSDVQASLSTPLSPLLPGELLQSVSPDIKIVLHERELKKPFDETLTNDIDSEIETLNLPKRFYTIYGKVTTLKRYSTNEDLNKLNFDKGDKGFIESLAKIVPLQQPVPNAVVVLKSYTISKQIHTDSEGKFEFTLLTKGIYELSCETLLKGQSGEQQTATDRKLVDLRNNCGSGVMCDLDVRSDRITIKGRITDQNGRPLAGVKVTGKQCPDLSNIEPEEYYGSPISIPEFTTVSSADGSYSLYGFVPSGAYPKIFRFLVYGVQDRIDHAEIHVENPSGTQENVTKVVLLNEQSLACARRFVEVMSKNAHKLTGKEMELKEKEDISLPSIHGNTITGVDIVLNKLR